MRYMIHYSILLFFVQLSSGSRSLLKCLLLGLLGGLLLGHNDLGHLLKGLGLSGAGLLVKVGLLA